MQRAKLTEKSVTARKMGGAEFIRALPRVDRLMLSAEIASDLGRKKPKHSCARRYFNLMKEKGSIPPELAGIAMRYSIRPELREAIVLQAKTDPVLASQLALAEKHFHSGNKEAGRKAVLRTIRNQLTDVDPRISRALYLLYRIKYAEIKPVAKEVFNQKMASGEFESAYLVAREWRLYPERKTSTLASIRQSITTGKFKAAEQKAINRGIGKKGLRSIAKQVFSGHTEAGEHLKALQVAETFRVMGGAQKAALEIYSECIEEKRYLEAAQIAKHYGLISQMNEAAMKLIDSLKERSLVSTVRHAREFGLDELADELGKKLMEVELLLGNYANAIAWATKLGLNTNDIARTWFEKELEENGAMARALFVANRYGLEEEKKEVGMRFFRKYLAVGNIRAAQKIVKECGLEQGQSVLDELARFKKRSQQPR